jgi:hypothetical protein
MVLSRGLVISLGVSALGCTLLFLYFRHRMTNIENKVNVMFDLIQNHQPGPEQNSSEQNRPEQYYSQHEVSLQTDVNESELQQDDVSKKNTNTLIEVSDNESDADPEEQYHSDDSMSVSDEEDSDDEPRKTISLAHTEQISLNQEDIKKIIVPLTNAGEGPDTNSLPELEELHDSLDELDEVDDADTSGEEEEATPDDVGQHPDKVEVTKSEDSDTVEPFDYNKLKVSELKALAHTKGLTNYKKLKKAPLIALLKENETNE